MAARIVADGTEGRVAAVEALQAGGIVAFPTDTVYGIGVAPGTPNGIERLFAAKERPPEKAIVLLLADADAVPAIARWTPAGEALARAFWPGGLTIVLPRATDARVRLALSHDLEPPPTVGLRVPDHPAPRALAAALGALPTTSANRSGLREAGDAAAIEEQLGQALSLILDAGPAPGGPPSTVVDASAEPVRVVRAGAVSTEAIAAALRAVGLEEPVGR